MVGFVYSLLQTNKSFQLSAEVDLAVVDEVEVVEDTVVEDTVVLCDVVLILLVVDVLIVVFFVDLLVDGGKVVVVDDDSIKKADSVFKFVGFGRFAGFHQAATDDSVLQSESPSGIKGFVESFSLGFFVNHRKADVGLTVFLLFVDFIVVLYLLC